MHNSNDQNHQTEQPRRAPRGEEAREAILLAATHLFSVHGFDGVGVRRIVEEAGVNVAMVNYYFGGKTGILREIYRQFFANLKQAVMEQYREAGISSDDAPQQAPPELDFADPLVQRSFIARLTATARAMTRTIRSWPELFTVVIREMAVPRPELNEQRAQSIRDLFPIVYGPYAHQMMAQLNTEGVPRVGTRQMRMDIVGPAFTASVFSHFMLQWALPFITGATYDDAFFEEYERTVPQLLLFGLFGRIPDEPADGLDQGTVRRSAAGPTAAGPIVTGGTSDARDRGTKDERDSTYHNNQHNGGSTR